MMSTRLARTPREKRFFFVNNLLSVLFVALAGTTVAGCFGEFGTPPEGVDCKPLTSKTCSCDDGSMGIQSCNAAGDRWQSCQCSCSPYQVESCECAEGTEGYRECAPTGDYWLACQCLGDGEEITYRVEELQDDRCGVGEVYCPDFGCVNLGNDADNCGMCGRTCEGCDRCYLGACTEVCCSDETNCGTDWNRECADLDSDPDNCGGCGRECAADESCVRGSCV